MTTCFGKDSPHATTEKTPGRRASIDKCCPRSVKRWFPNGECLVAAMKYYCHLENSILCLWYTIESMQRPQMQP